MDDKNKSQLMLIVAATLVCFIVFAGVVGFLLYKWKTRRDAENAGRKIEENLSKMHLPG